MKIVKKCDVCGKDFIAPTAYAVCCNECKATMYKSLEQERKHHKTKVNQGIIEAVKEATALGMSYGEYMGYPLRRRRS